MLIAPAGFGKTEAVVDAFGAAAHWVNLSENGVTVEGLARDLITSTASHALRALSPLLARAPNDENRQHLTGWVASRLRSVEQPIVIEDFQRACIDADALAFVRELITATVPQIRWVLVSRETPELPIGTWLARDYMTLPVTTDDLAFDADEAAGVAAAMNVEISDDALAELVDDTSGWPLAMRLALDSWERTRSLPPLRIRTRAVLFDFLESEVWSRLSETEREFLEVSANLSELRPRILAAAGFPESRLSLERLHKRLPLLSKLGNGAYRLHELFRDFILERSDLDPAKRSELVRGLARALERFGSLEEAVAIIMRVADWEGAIRLLARHGVDRMESGHRAEITAALAAFPASYRNHPVITGLRGFALAIDGAYDAAREELEAALRGKLDPVLRGPLVVQLGATAFNRGRPQDAIPILRAAMIDEHLDSEIRLKAAANLALDCATIGDAEGARDAMGFCTSGLEAGSVEVRATLRHRIAYAYFLLGELSMAEHHATECTQLAHSVGLDGIAARGYSILQNVAIATYADTTLARRYCESCLQAAEACGDRPLQLYAINALVSLACEQGDDELFATMYARLGEFDLRTHIISNVWIRFTFSVREAGLGNVERAIGELRLLQRNALRSAEAAFVNAAIAVLQASLDPELAAPLLEKAPLVSAEKGLEAARFLSFAQAFHALGHWLIGQGRAARRSRMPNIADLHPSDAALVTAVMTICSTARSTLTARQLDQLTEPLVALGFGGYARFLRRILAPAAIRELTRTELEILRELRRGGTTADVAERVGRSSHTVLTHLKSACAKIGCSGRAAAIAYAVNQGWID